MNKEHQKQFNFTVNPWLTIAVWANHKAEALSKAYKFGIADLKVK